MLPENNSALLLKGNAFLFLPFSIIDPKLRAAPMGQPAILADDNIIFFLPTFGVYGASQIYHGSPIPIIK